MNISNAKKYSCYDFLYIEYMNEDEFLEHVQHIVDVLGHEAVLFFTIIKNMEAFFLDADEKFYGSPLLFNEFEEIGESIKDILGQEEGKRFFKAIYDTLPTQTVHYLSILVKLFELGKTNKP